MRVDINVSVLTALKKSSSYLSTANSILSEMSSYSIQSQQKELEEEKAKIDNIVKVLEGDILTECRNQIEQISKDIKEYEKQVEDNKKKLKELEREEKEEKEEKRESSKSTRSSKPKSSYVSPYFSDFFNRYRSGGGRKF